MSPQPAMGPTWLVAATQALGRGGLRRCVGSMRYLCRVPAIVASSQVHPWYRHGHPLCRGSDSSLPWLPRCCRPASAANVRQGPQLQQPRPPPGARLAPLPQLEDLQQQQAQQAQPGEFEQQVQQEELAALRAGSALPASQGRVPPSPRGDLQQQDQQQEEQLQQQQQDEAEGVPASPLACDGMDLDAPGCEAVQPSPAPSAVGPAEAVAASAPAATPSAGAAVAAAAPASTARRRSLGGGAWPAKQARIVCMHKGSAAGTRSAHGRVAKRWGLVLGSDPALAPGPEERGFTVMFEGAEEAVAVVLRKVGGGVCGRVPVSGSRGWHLCDGVGLGGGQLWGWFVGPAAACWELACGSSSRGGRKRAPGREPAGGEQHKRTY